MIIPIKQGYDWHISQKWGNTDFGVDPETGKPKLPYGTLSDTITARPHNGVDFGISLFTPLVFCAPCLVVKVVTDPSYGGGYGCCVWFVTDSINGIQYLGIYGHMALGQIFVKLGEHYNQGELVGLSDNTGFSSGSHLHWNMQPVEQNGDPQHTIDFDSQGKWSIIDWNERTSGSVDPMGLLQGISEVLPVDVRYGQAYSSFREKIWSLKYNEKEVWNRARTVGYGLTEFKRMKNAFIYGYWDFEFVMNVANFVTWSQITKPEYLKRFIKL